MAEKLISPGVFIRENDRSAVPRGTVSTGAAIVGPTVKGRPLVPTVVTSYSEYQIKFGDAFKEGNYYQEYFTSIAAREYFNNGGTSLLVTPIISGSPTSIDYSSTEINSGDGQLAFELEVLHFGSLMDNAQGGASATGALYDGTADNVRWEVTAVDTVKGTFTLLIRSGDDTNENKNIIETYTNLTLDPLDSNFISRRVGDQKPIYVSADGGYIKTIGSYENVSSYVRIKSVNPTINAFDNDGVFKSQFVPKLPVESYGGFEGGEDNTELPKLFFDEINSAAQSAQGFVAEDYEAAFNLLTNKEEYDFNILVAPGLFLSNAYLSALDLVSVCESRKDSIAIVDPVVYDSSKVAARTAGEASGSSYGTAYWPWVQVFSSVIGRSVWVPASVVMLGVYAFNDQVGLEWMAPAGFTRGGIGSVLQAERKLSVNDRDYLYAANINPLATFPGEGVVAYGQKTLQKKVTALDRVNVRRLLIHLRRYIGNVALQLDFEQNTAATRNKFLSTVNPFLEDVVQKQGLYAFRVTMDDTNNTSDVIDRQELVGDIAIKPTKTSEYIILNFNVNPSGASFT